jgi:nicotinamide-nucleotide amidase
MMYQKTFCDYFEDELVEDQKVLAQVTKIIEGFYKRPITQINKDQALVPSKCTSQSGGTAPGMWMKRKHRFYFAAGVPYEMKYLVENEIIPKVVRIRTAVHYPQNNSYLRTGRKPDFRAD